VQKCDAKQHAPKPGHHRQGRVPEGHVTDREEHDRRGTEIKLGLASPDRGGLHIPHGTERNEARRSTTSCAAVAGRQGDPGGKSRLNQFDDELMRGLEPRASKGIHQKLRTAPMARQSEHSLG